MAVAEQMQGRIAPLRAHMALSRVQVALVYRAASAHDPMIKLLLAVVQQLS